MQRLQLEPRPDWPQECESVGFNYHSMDGIYWDESHCYRLTAAEVAELESATRALHELAREAVEHIIASDLFDRLAIPPGFVEYVKSSWRTAQPTLAGRFDLAYDGSGPPKLLEYNADTPTALLEASVVQWRWLEQAIRPRIPEADQFNSLHEKLLASWRAIAITFSADAPVHFACVKDSDEDLGNIGYQRDLAAQAGLATRFVYIEDIGWASEAGLFVDRENEPITVLCKLYPWEWLIRDEFGPHLTQVPLRLFEPAWKMLLSNKALLPILWELNPGHPNLLPAAFERWRISGDYVQKPIYSREGANVTLYRGAEVLREGGSYGGEGWIYQAYTPIAHFDDSYAVIGSWIVGDEPAGIGIREDPTPITRNSSRFVPHYFT